MENEEKLALETEICKKCKNLVVGKGSLSAEIMFVGEAPGKNEDEQGIPFVGAAGKNLDKLLEKVGLTLKEIYVTNILKCRPPENRNPTKEEIEAHKPWLVKQIKEIRPKIICSLGNYSTKFFLAQGDVDKMEEQPGITKVHGQVYEMEFEGLRIKLIPLFHPAAIIYNKKFVELWEEDLKIVKKEIKK